MMDKELIRQEIERRIDLYSIVEKADSVFARMGELSSLIDFIDSIPEEPASEDLKEELNRWQIYHDYPEEYLDLLNFARHFAEWQRRQDEKLFKDDSWNYIEENYPNISQEEKLRLYDISIKSRLAGANTIKQKMKETTQTEYEKGERGNDER